MPNHDPHTWLTCSFLNIQIDVIWILDKHLNFTYFDSVPAFLGCVKASNGEVAYLIKIQLVNGKVVLLDK